LINSSTVSIIPYSNADVISQKTAKAYADLERPKLRRKWLEEVVDEVNDV